MRKLLLFCAVTAFAALGCADSRRAGIDMRRALARYERQPAPSAPVRRTDAAEANAKPVLAAAVEEAPSARQSVSEPEETSAPHWSRRYGPAYPDDFWRTVGRDMKDRPTTLWDDARATITNPNSLVLFALAGSAATLRAAGDDCVEDHYTRRGPQLPSALDTAGEVLGSPVVHFPVAGVMYATSLAHGDSRNYEVSKTLINALTINSATTFALKAIVNTRRPDGDRLGWPSGHTSSSFCLATVMHESYGPWVGVPMYGFATFVAYQRIDSHRHHLSDVVSGAFLGIAIGHAVSRNREARLLGMDVVPYTDPQRGGNGLALMKRW